jgi:hypothetical protein
VLRYPSVVQPFDLHLPDVDRATGERDAEERSVCLPISPDELGMRAVSKNKLLWITKHL